MNHTLRPFRDSDLEKAGFTCDARLKDAVYKNGHYMDELIYVKRKEV